MNRFFELELLDTKRIFHTEFQIINRFHFHLAFSRLTSFYHLKMLWMCRSRKNNAGKLIILFSLCIEFSIGWHFDYGVFLKCVRIFILKICFSLSAFWEYQCVCLIVHTAVVWILLVNKSKRLATSFSCKHWNIRRKIRSIYVHIVSLYGTSYVVGVVNPFKNYNCQYLLLIVDFIISSVSVAPIDQYKLRFRLFSHIEALLYL